VLEDARRVPTGTVLRSDVCIIGAGAAGISAALELVAGGVDAVLLEAGGIRAEAGTDQSLAGEITANDDADLHPGSLHPPLETLRQRRIGGTTGVWGGRCIPLDTIDFEAREGVRAGSWPISPSELAPYYRRAQTYCDVGAYEYDQRAALPAASKFLLQDDQVSSITDSKLLRYSLPTDFGRRYHRQLQREKKLRTFFHATVVRLEGGSNGGAVAAIVAGVPNREFRVEASVFLIAGGGLESTRLVLASMQHVGALGALKRTIGRYYMTHLDGAVGKLRFLTPVPEAAYTYEMSHDGVYIRRLICLTEAVLRREGLLNFSTVTYIPSPEEPSHRDSLLSAYAMAKHIVYRTRTSFKSRRYGLRKDCGLNWSAHLGNLMRRPGALPLFLVTWTRRRWLARRKLPSFLSAPASGEFRFLFSAEQSPVYSNSISLGSSTDAFGVPRLRVKWGAATADYENIVRGLRIIAREIERLGVGMAAVPRGADELAEEIGGGFLGGTHAMGALRMASSPSDGVVDAECRIHGLRNTYVASSAVFPTGGFAAPTLTVVALALRVADHVREHGLIRALGDG
jgi:choline dehydrogenase-like flavoprotein